MLGRAFTGYTPGTTAARRLGVLALVGGRPDLLGPSDPLEATRGRGIVTLTQRGVLVVGAAPVRVLAGNFARSALTIANITHLNSDGTESSSWVFLNGQWRTPEGQTRVDARLMFAFNTAPATRDRTIDVGKEVKPSGNDKGDVWMKAVGTNGASVRYLITVVNKYPEW